MRRLLERRWLRHRLGLCGKFNPIKVQGQIFIKTKCAYCHQIWMGLLDE